MLINTVDHFDEYVRVRRRNNSPGEYTMHIFDFCSIWVEFYSIHRVRLIAVSLMRLVDPNFIVQCI